MAWNTNDILYAVAGLLVVLSVLVIRLEWKLRRFLRGGKSDDLGGTLAFFEEELKSFRAFKREAGGRMESMEARLMQSLRGVGLVRFHPFKGTGEGGNRSFALSLIDEKGDGLVVSSLSTRDRLILFTKSVSGFKGESELSAEERDSLAMARENLKNV